MALTLAQIKSRVVDSLEMSDYTIVDETEVTRYINQGIKTVEAKIHNLYEDYYLTSSDLSLVANTSEYSLPTDLYSDKIRKIIYDDGNDDEYEIKRIKHLEELKYIDDASDQGDYDYKYQIINPSTGRKIKIYPIPNENTVISDAIWYIRRASQLSLDADTLDIPEEFENVVILYAQKECLKKDLANPAMLTSYTAEYATETKLMEDTLSNRQPDRDDTIRMDTSFYWDFYSNGDYD